MAPKGPEPVGKDDLPQPGASPYGDDTRTERRRSSQLGRSGRPRMANISETVRQPRRAEAEAVVGVSQETLSGMIDGTVARGDVLGVAELAGVMAAKRTAELIPLAHSTPLTELLVIATPDRAAGAVRIKAETGATSAAGVEMEALTAAAVAALTLYDMVRDTDPGAEIRGVRLLSSSSEDGVAWGRPAGVARSGRPGGHGSGRGERPRGVRMAGRTGTRPGPSKRGK
jgi:cyclic pyranopterin phosphate synthase